MAAPKDTNPIAEQGEAAYDLGLTRADCPYGEGDNRDAWIDAFNAKAAKRPAPATDA